MRPDRLERFRRAKQTEIAALEQAAAQGGLPAPLTGARPDFRAALRRPATGAPAAVIAEYKRASPSRGTIATGITPEDAAAQYAAAGASCLSVLTEETYFRGRLEFLSRMTAPGLPLLRKDFLFHSLQIVMTAATPASALLLIVRLTPDVRVLRDLREQAEAHGLHAVVEVFDAADLTLARDSGARIIQVNARNLETLAVDRGVCLRLAEQHRATQGGADECWIAASGMDSAEHLRDAADAGYDAVLVGTALMAGGQPGAALRRLLGNGNAFSGVRSPGGVRGDIPAGIGAAP